jgi:uncharacterized protein YbaA (DUF1428 family)
MTYVDGFVAAVSTANREIYKKHAEAAAVVFKEHGALKLVECWGDDVPDGKVTSFPMAVKRKDDETVVFSWIIWPSRKVRDQGIKSWGLGRSSAPSAYRVQNPAAGSSPSAGFCFAPLRAVAGTAPKIIQISGTNRL